jgi:hypothetical protein
MAIPFRQAVFGALRASDENLYQPEMGVSTNGIQKNGWFIMENPSMKLMISGYLHFRKPPNSDSNNQ